MRNYIFSAIAASLVMAGGAVAQEAQRAAQGRETQRAPASQRDQFEQPGQTQRQQQRQPGQIEREARRPIGQPPQLGQPETELETYIASVGVLVNKAQVALNEELKDRLESDQVREFAEKMIEDHGACEEKLQRFAPRAAMMEIQIGEERETQPEARQPGQQLGRQPGQQPGQQAGRTPGSPGQTGQLSEQLLDIEQRSIEKGLTKLVSAFEEKEGAELDKAYLTHQVAAHMAMGVRLEVIEGHVSGELQEIVRESKEKVDEHLEKAKELLKDQEES